MGIGDTLVKHYADVYGQWGDSARGMDWPSDECAAVRYENFLQIALNKGNPFEVIYDFGCGSGRFQDYIKTQNKLAYEAFKFVLIDGNQNAISCARRKHPQCDYAYSFQKVKFQKHTGPVLLVFNGVFTEKQSVSHSEFENYLFETVKTNLELARSSCESEVIAAFNVMKHEVDWSRLDLFHWSFARASKVFERGNLRLVEVDDYGLFETTFLALC